MAKRKLRVQDAEKWLVLSDPHYPFQNKPYIKAIKRFAQDLDPHVVVLNGDGLDFYDLSRFNKNPERRFKLKELYTQTTFRFMLSQLLKNLTTSHDLKFW